MLIKKLCVLCELRVRNVFCFYNETLSGLSDLCGETFSAVDRLLKDFYETGKAYKSIFKINSEEESDHKGGSVGV
jgi:hypothetical protein